MDQTHSSPSQADKTDSPAIEVNRVSFRYGDRPALRGITFSVQRNHIFGLLGPNGGGKTTLFRILCTLLVPDEGEARLAGIDVKTNPHEARRRIGVVFQSHSLDLQLTVVENLFCQGRMFGLRGQQLRNRVEMLLDRFGLKERKKDLVRTLSGGLRRRLELAKGVLHRPEILLLDEPTEGLDPRARRDFWSDVNQFRERDGVTVLIATHLMEEAERCDNLVILDEGAMVCSGSPQALKEKIGGDVVVIHTPDPERLRMRIEKEFACHPGVVNGTVRLEIPEGREMVSRLIETYPNEIEAVTVGKPTLEDVFIHETGHRLGSSLENEN